MNVPADIAAVLLKYPSGKLSVTMIEDLVGLTTGTCGLKISQMQEKGLIRRQGNLVQVVDVDELRRLAQAARAELQDAVSNGSAGTAASRPPAAPPAVPLPPAAVTVKPTLRSRLALSSTPVRKGVPLPPPRIGRAVIMPEWDYKSLEEPGDSLVFAVPEGLTPRDVADQLRKDIATIDRIRPPFYAAIRVLEGDKEVGLWRLAAAEKRGDGLKQAAAAARELAVTAEAQRSTAAKGKKK